MARPDRQIEFAAILHFKFNLAVVAQHAPALLEKGMQCP
jgi:hypothetical protein